MDLIINYPGFDTDIRNTFKDLIEEFHLELIELSEGSYLLSGELCNIRFTYDRGDIACDFKQPFDKKDCQGYSIWQVYRFLYPTKSSSEYTERVYDAKQQLFECADMIKKNLKIILNGDFAWLGDFLANKKREDKIFSIAFNLRYDHPIREKLRTGDLTWCDDIEKYIAEKHIKI